MDLLNFPFEFPNIPFEFSFRINLAEECDGSSNIVGPRQHTNLYSEITKNRNYKMVVSDGKLVINIQDTDSSNLEGGGTLTVKPLSEHSQRNIQKVECLDNGSESLEERLDSLKFLERHPNKIFNIYVLGVPWDCFIAREPVIVSVGNENFGFMHPYSERIYKSIMYRMRKNIMYSENIDLCNTEFWSGELLSELMRYAELLENSNVKLKLQMNARNLRSAWFYENPEVTDYWMVLKRECRLLHSDLNTQWQSNRRPTIETMIHRIFANNMTTKGRRIMARKAKVRIKRETQYFLSKIEKMGSIQTFCIRKF